ncbi:hypothetical protein A6R68_19583 [Neotoma lepida]|uniref:Uncharacterized protein n=1 Tax=Neotoma lepida TaxID=56216 RepID=A0A1A6HIH0_NEOLE|nr:hypothetical protein A6R68_19583 [Neotoma lepida]
MYGAGHKFRTLHLPVSTTLSDVLDRVSDTPSITAKLISEQKDDKEKKNHEEKEKVKAENGFQDNYSVVVASGMLSAFCHLYFPCLIEHSTVYLQ